MAGAAPQDIFLADSFGWRAHLPRLRDPGHASLRRAARAALLVPGVFALLLYIAPDPGLTTFATFGAFSQLVFGDFGGLRGPRAAAYALTTLVGVPIIALGTIVSGAPWAAALAVAVVAFVLQFVGVFGGYVTAAQLPLTLSLVLSVAIQAPPDQVPLRLVGWVVGGAVALVGGVFLWPRHEQVSLRKLAADCCEALAELYQALFVASSSGQDLERKRNAAQRALESLRQAYRDTPHRPVGATRSARVFAELVDELGRVMKLTPTSNEPRRNALRETDLLAESAIQVLHGSARVLRGEGRVPDLALLEARRQDAQTALANWAADQLRAGTTAHDVLEGLEAERALSRVQFVILVLGGNAILASGMELSQNVAAILWRNVELERGLSADLRRIVETVRTQLQPSGIWFRNSLRAAAGLSLAVLVVDLLGVDHAFWAVLGTLSVLRSNALATGRTAVSAIVGTALGIFPASLLLIPVGTDTSVLWVAFPPAAFVAAYAPSVIGFVAGQAAFTLLVVVLFNLIQPVGWVLGLIRLEDVLIGTGLSLVVGLLFWPRGARGQLLTAFAALYRREASYVRAAFGRLYGEASVAEARLARESATAEAARAGEVFDQFLNDRAAKRLPPETWAALQAGGSHLLLSAETIERIADKEGPVTACEPAAPALSNAVTAIVQQLVALSDSLEHAQPPPSSVDSAAVPEEQLREATIDCLRTWGGADDATRRASAMTLVAARDWTHSISVLLDHFSGPAAAAVRLASVAWWR